MTHMLTIVLLYFTFLLADAQLSGFPAIETACAGKCTKPSSPWTIDKTVSLCSPCQFTSTSSDGKFYPCVKTKSRNTEAIVQESAQMTISQALSIGLPSCDNNYGKACYQLNDGSCVGDTCIVSLYDAGGMYTQYTMNDHVVVCGAQRIVGKKRDVYNLIAVQVAVADAEMTTQNSADLPDSQSFQHLNHCDPSHVGQCSASWIAQGKCFMGTDGSACANAINLNKFIYPPLFHSTFDGYPQLTRNVYTNGAYLHDTQEGRFNILLPFTKTANGFTQNGIFAEFVETSELTSDYFLTPSHIATVTLSEWDSEVVALNKLTRNDNIFDVKIACGADARVNNFATSPLGSSAVSGWTPSTPQPCLNGGVVMWSGLCKCPAGFGGQVCDEIIPPGINVLDTSCAEYDPCSGLGFCIDVTGVDATSNTTVHIVTCTCASGWYGSDAGVLSGYTGELDLYAHALFCGYADAAQSSEFQTLRTVVVENGFGTFNDISKPAMYLMLHQCLIYRGNVRPLNYVLDAVNPLVPVMPVTCTGSVVRDPYTHVVTSNTLTGGTGCLQCPPCNVLHGKCVDAPDILNNPTIRVCECTDPNYSVFGEHCTVPMCPVSTNAATVNSPCGNHNNQGMCLAWAQTTPITTSPESGYLSECECNPGWYGPACDQKKCAFGPGGSFSVNGLVCSGRGTCDELNDVCICDSTSVGGWKGDACDIPQCITDYGNAECSNVDWTVSDLNHMGTVCNNQTSRVCECWRSRCTVGNGDYVSFLASTPTCPTNTYTDICDCFLKNAAAAKPPLSTTVISAPSYAMARYGPGCQYNYKFECVIANSPNPDEFCSGRGVCVPDDYTDNASIPKCVCIPPYKGKFCESDVCGGKCGVGGTCVRQSDGTGRCCCKKVGSLIYYSSDDQNPTCDQSSTSCSSGVSVGTDPLCNNQNIYKICNGRNELCNRNSQTGGCDCGSVYTGTYCQTSACTLCNRAGMSQIGCNTATGKCDCGSSFVQDATCFINFCSITGGTVTNSADVCNCPVNGVRYPTVGVDLTPYTFGSEFMSGCRRQCVVDPSTRVECRHRRSRLATDTDSARLTCFPIVFSNSSVIPTCVCNGQVAFDIDGSIYRRLITGADGMCEFYCQNGADEPNTPTSMHCGGEAAQCPIGWTGSRCDQAVCKNDGIMTTLGVCKCKLPYTGDICTETTCDENGSYRNGDAACTCALPFEPDPAGSFTCVSACGVYGTPGVGACKCDDVAYGNMCQYSYCDASNGGTIAIVESNEAESYCKCKVPQYQSQFCNISQCVHGSPISSPTVGCDCINGFYSGTLCEKDECMLNGQGVNANTTGVSECVCDAGYIIDDDGFCNKNACGFFGVHSPCTGDACIRGAFDYNCDCGSAGVFTSTGVCRESTCSGNGYVRLVNSSVISECICDVGWTGDTCQSELCPASQHKRLSSVDNSTCACIPTYSSSSPGTVTCDINVCTAAGLVIDTSSNSETCKCMNVQYTHVGINGVNSVTCVLNCVAVNTLSLSVTGDACVCRSGWKGNLCQIRVVTSSMFSMGEIVGISIGGVFVLVSILGVMWWLLHTTAIK